jgi:hypothetical protein
MPAARDSAGARLHEWRADGALPTRAIPLIFTLSLYLTRIDNFYRRDSKSGAVIGVLNLIK